jgi:ribosome maturation factor RimP
MDVVSDLESLRQDILKQVEPLCVGMGLELVELSVRGHAESMQVEVLVDLPAGGIGIEECTRLNRALDKQLYEVLDLGNTYTLEVSSPGLDRPLRTIADFRRSVGNHVHFFLRERVECRVELQGRVVGAAGSDVQVELKTGMILIPVDKIEKGKIIIA